MFPKTFDPDHMAQNIDIFDFELTEDEMADMNALSQKPYHIVPDQAPDFVLAVNDYDAQE